MTRRGSRRTPSACEACRKRKKKCDGQKPRCLACAAYATTCRYPTEKPSRRRKYWDEGYVRSLEGQVATLTSTLDELGPTATDVSPDSEINHCSLTHSPGTTTPLRELLDTTRFSRALSDFASLNWFLLGSSGDRPPLFTGPTGRFSIYKRKILPTFENAQSRTSMVQPPSRSHISEMEADISLDMDTKSHLTELFLRTVNVYYKFVDPEWLIFSHIFPHNDLALQFLYSTIFAVTSHISPRVDESTAVALMMFAEKLAMECCQDHLCLPVVQALLILAWHKQTVLDSARGYMYHYMAIGLSTHLGIDHQRYYNGATSWSDIAPSVRTFWSMFVVDRISTPTLGREASIPWDITKVPRYISTVPPEDVDMATVAFEALCQLLELQQRHIDTIYSFSYESFPTATRLAHFLKACASLTLFRQNIDSRLLVTRTTTPEPPQLIFWIAYHSSILNLHRPFVNSTSRILLEGHDPQASLSMVTAAADTITQLLRQLDSIEGLRDIPPFTIYHILRVALVHGINLTVAESQARQKTLSSLRVCVNALRKVVKAWPSPANMCLSFIHDVMKSWGLDPVTWQ